MTYHQNPHGTISADQPIDPASGRFVCTASRPMPSYHGHTLWMHPDAVSTDEHDPYYDCYHCPHCDENFKCEVAD